jgi:hypothetical protein
MKKDVNRGLVVVTEHGHEIKLMTNIDENIIELIIDEKTTVRLSESDLDGLARAISALKEHIIE